ncbi:NAD(P)/FAD-dependent oxidoreductase [Salarchaeum sp. JOR-1]|uniref:NAD(P)/FAD-dependent oxidoreductase n=1 Tax=Salarchaeum sp. JOR-1 TaxID=2599399 RepID=UPI001198C19D|nr:FAD-dependent oxidoreductase [Salarchaeum sp. JOR-1]QDX41063.1 NAD(P)/FAD-dependent oxidoreductase [Salarchaeum sp. JOR-1]
MSPTVAVLGAGYAGAGAIPELEDRLGDDADIVWISDTDYHLVLHEAHRCIRDPGVREKITIPVTDIKSPRTQFVQAEVTGLDTDDRVVELDGADDVAYDYVLVALGSQTAYYGIEGMAENALTLKSLDDALDIHERVKDAAREATREDPATVVIGGAGLSGIQSAGEVAEFRDKHNAPVEVYLVEALPEIFPPGDAEVQGALRHHLEEADVNILTDDPITSADDEEIHFDERDSLDYDVFVWTGGITGRDALDDTSLENEHNRLNTGQDFQTSDDRVFAIGDSAIIEQPGENPAPPTALAAWQAAEVAAKNVANAIDDHPLETWTYHDEGTLISIGDTAVAHEVTVYGIDAPVRTFNGLSAKMLKKGAAARWIAKITSPTRAIKAWDAL